MQKKMWLTPEVLSWRPSVESSMVYANEQWRRPYDIWAHADQIFQRQNSEFHRIDGITTLKRAVDNRLNLLKEIYKFRNIPIKDKPSDILEIMGYLGIIRPIMLQNLINIRNKVEHEDAPPPALPECLYFLEFVWYFLRSTDHLVRNSVASFILEPDSDSMHYGLESRMSPETMWNPSIGGWVKSDIISEEFVNDWILLNVEKTNTRASLLSKLGQPDDPEDIGRGKDPDDIYFKGEIRGPAEHLKRIVLIYFEAV